MKLSDCYFKFVCFDEPCVVITSKQLWDQEQILDDKSSADQIVKQELGLLSLMESVYDFPPSEESRIRNLLLEKGAVENNDLTSDE